MRRFSFGVTLAALPAFALSLMLAGCGGGNKESSSSGGGSGGDSETSKPKEVKVLEPAKGVLKGKIVLKGSAPIEELNKHLEAEMKKKDTEYCMKGMETEKTEQTYRVGKDNTLGNVFVWIVPEDAGSFFKVDKTQLAGLEKEVKISQPHCAFIPHAAFLFSQYKSDPKKPTKLEPTGQKLKIVNNAKISHNTNWGGGAKNKGGNVLLGEGKDQVVDNLKPEAKEVTIKCNIHPWMDAYLRVVDTPYYAVSLSDTLDGKDKVAMDDPKFGTYEIKNLPEGVKVRVIAWHEKCGFLNKDGGKGEVIEILPKKETTKDFEATAK